MKKRQKSRLAMYIIGGISAISLGSIGFASWVVTTEHGTADKNISVDVGTVTNNSTSITVNDSQSDLTLNFDNVESPTGEFFDNNTGGTEKLGFKINFTVTGNTSAYSNIVFTFSGALTEDKYNNYLGRPYSTSTNKTITYTLSWSPATISGTNQVIDLPSGVQNTITNSGTTTTITANFYFKWGDIFKNKNPGNLKTTDGVTKDNVIKNTDDFYKLITADKGNVSTTPLLKVTIQAAA